MSLSLFEDDGGPPGIDADDGSFDLPAYPLASRRLSNSSPSTPSTIRDTARTEHFLSLSSRGRPWLTLTLISSANSEKSLPLFLEGQNITGCLELNLEKSENIRAIEIIIKGLLVVSGIDMKQFLEKSHTLWDSSKGDYCENSNTGEGHIKNLSGKHTWPVSIALPKEVNITQRQAKDLEISPTHLLPPSFVEKSYNSIITYELTVAVKRKGPFRGNSTLTIPFNYVPRSKAGAPSELRQLAYQENAPLFGPEIDPSGWRLPDPARLIGYLFDKQKLEIKCTLALASPLSYPRGSVIPCFLILESNNMQALDLLSNTSVPVVQLRRKVNFDNPGLSPMADFDADMSRVVSRALWMRRRNNTNLAGETYSECKRVMEGEIPIPENLLPSFTFGKYFLDYRVELLPLKTAGFYPVDESRLSKQKVEITTDYPPGPRPIAYLPPGYNNSTEDLPSSNVFSRTLNMISGFL